MRYIELSNVADAVEGLCDKVAHELSRDMVSALDKALQRERDAGAANILRQLLENARIGSDQRIPLCQDTGLAVVFVEQGADVCFTYGRSGQLRTLDEAIDAGVAAGYEKSYLRKSVVAEPLRDRANTKTNTPAIVHHSFCRGDKLSITLMAKGGGCENKSQFRMFRPTSSAQQVADWIVEVAQAAGADACPPFVLGVGIGGNFETSCLLSKKALTRDVDKPNDDAFYAEMEAGLLERVNALGIGPQGLGGDTTALAVCIETGPCHIASLPVAVNIECHSHRHKSIEI